MGKLRSKETEMFNLFIPVLSLVASFYCCENNISFTGINFSSDTLQYPEEKHFKNLRQLTLAAITLRHILASTAST